MSNSVNALTKPKAVYAFLIAFLIPFLTSLLNSDSVTWRTFVVAIVAALVANQGVYRLPHSSDKTSD